ncbi:MAG: hemolysin family protein [Termitinemataceae bacterium]|nr:MAG: hemolysin family protein [Termitinemataceae bacterium]
MSEDPLLYKLGLQFILILINAVFASAEIALISVNTNKLQKYAASGDKRAKRLLFIKNKPEKFLATIQLGITIAGFLGSVFAADSFSDNFVDLMRKIDLPFRASAIKTISLITITIIISFFTMVLGELLPKRIAMKKPEQLAYTLSFFLFLISKILSPAVWILTQTTRGLLFLLRFDPKEDEDTVTEEEILLMVDASSEKGQIEQSEKEVITNIFEFDDKIASDVMTHRLEAVLLNTKDSDETWENTIIENAYSYYPVCGETFDEVLGVLSSRDFLLLSDRTRKNVMDNAVHPALFVPHTVKTDVLLKKMKQHHNYFVLVLDEYGGLAGLVSITDLLESIVGDLGFED